MLIYNGQINTTTASGSASENTKHIRGLFRHLVIKPTTETTRYNLSIVNPAGAEIYYRTSETGTLSEILDIPVLGVYTISISSATKDEAFIIQTIIEE